MWCFNGIADDKSSVFAFRSLKMLEKTAHCYSSSSFRNSCKITYRLCNSRRLALMAELMSLKWLLHSAASAVKPTAITHVNTWVKVSVQHRSKAYLFHSEKRRNGAGGTLKQPSHAARATDTSRLSATAGLHYVDLCYRLYC